MSRHAFLEARKLGIGGSDVAPILGLSQWRTPLDVYLEKTSDFVNDVSHKGLRRGSALEPLVLARYAQQTGCAIDALTGPVVSQTHQFMRANLDGYNRTASAIVEAKTSRSKDDWGLDGTDDVPVYYQTQVQHYLAVTGEERCHLPVLIGDGLDWREAEGADGASIWLPTIAADADFRIFVLHRDEMMIEKIIAAEHAFWRNHVLAGVPPNPINAEDAAKLWPKDTTASKEVQAEDAARIAEYKALKRSVTELEERITFLRDQIVISFADASNLVFEGKVLATYKSQERRGINTELLRKSHPAIAGECTKVSTSRTLRTK